MEPTVPSMGTGGNELTEELRLKIQANRAEALLRLKRKREAEAEQQQRDEKAKCATFVLHSPQEFFASSSTNGTTAQSSHVIASQTAPWVQPEQTSAHSPSYTHYNAAFSGGSNGIHAVKQEMPATRMGTGFGYDARIECIQSTPETTQEPFDGASSYTPPTSLRTALPSDAVESAPASTSHTSALNTKPPPVVISYQADIRDVFGLDQTVAQPQPANYSAAAPRQLPEYVKKRGMNAKTKEPPESQAEQGKPTLSEEQQRVVDQAVKGLNVFLTGCGGTGKSFLMNTVISKLKRIYGIESVAVTATTGIAATHIGGTSLHNFAGIGLGQGSVEELVKRIRNNRKFLMRWQKTRALVIDEISMLDGPLFDKIEAIARGIKQVDAPFGGIHLLLVGDFFQLPPVTRNRKEPIFCFESECWKKVVHVHVELKKVFRQADESFVSVLNSIRWGQWTPQVQEMLKAAQRNTLSVTNGIRPTILYPKNAEVDGINAQSLKNLKTPSEVFDAEDTGEQPYVDQLKKNCLAPERLELKLGAQVMLLKNVAVTEGLTNGTRGVVESIIDEVNPKDGVVTKQINIKFETFRGELIQAIAKEDFSIEQGGKVLATRTQYPLRLAYAITIHKCQGMTLSKVEMSLRDVFEPGQAYVALSRASSPEGLRVLNFQQRNIHAHPKVVQFYRSMGIGVPPMGVPRSLEMTHAQQTPVTSRVNPLLIDD